MLPGPDVQFDFNLPHGIDTDDNATTNDEDTNGNGEDDNSMGLDIDMREGSDSGHDGRNLGHGPTMDDQNSTQHDMNYDRFEKGFSDDDNAPEAFDRSWPAPKARRSPPKKKKSPRSDDTDDEASTRSKKPRQALFGGSAEEVEADPHAGLFDEQANDHPVNGAGESPETEVPSNSIGGGMSNLNLNQQERGASPSQQTFNLGFHQPGDSDRESMSPRASPAPSDGEVIIPADTQPAYELRQGIDRKTTYTYVDQDESGNFDPADETRNNALKLRQARAAKAARATGQSKKGKQRAPKEIIMKCIVKLRIENFGTVRNITNDEENWPEDWSDIDSEMEREVQEYRGFFRHRTPNRCMQHPIPDPQDKVDDLTGYPIARGCISCRENETDCSLVTGGTYPCQECCDLNQDCEPIIPATEKGRCKQCMNDGIEPCSFEDEPSQAICDHCAEDEHICEALPPVGYRAERIIIDEVIYTEDRPFTQCTNCRLEKKRCSLKKKKDKPPCKNCKKNNIGCTFYDIPRPVKEKKSKLQGPTEGDAPEVAIPDHDYFTKEDLDDMYGEDEQMQSRSPTPELEMEDNDGHKGRLTKIKASFAHPIHFGARDNTHDCNFCEMPIFGFTGHFEKEVHVIRWYDGAGYTEVGGGYAENHGGTTMCQNCTIGRAQIVSCLGHELQHIFPDGTPPDFTEAVAELLEAAETPAEIQQQLQRWCSMCFTPATFVCCTRQVSLLSPEDAEEEIDGCGLRLCTGCQIKLTHDFNGDSSLMAETLDLQPKARDAGMDPEENMLVRADVGFLSSSGLLMNSLARTSEETGF